LLQHFSSKSTNQTTIILTAALALFAFFQTLQLAKDWPEWTHPFYEILVLTLLLFIALRACGRLILWGKLATLILVVKPENEEILAEGISKRGRGSTEEVTYFNRLVRGMDSRIRESRAIIILDALTNNILGCLLLFLLLCSCWGVVFTSSWTQTIFATLTAVLFIGVFCKICLALEKEFQKGVMP
jgi:hypothetical protein